MQAKPQRYRLSRRTNLANFRSLLQGPGSTSSSLIQHWSVESGLEPAHTFFLRTRGTHRPRQNSAILLNHPSHARMVQQALHISAFFDEDFFHAYRYSFSESRLINFCFRLSVSASCPQLQSLRTKISSATETTASRLPELAPVRQH